MTSAHYFPASSETQKRIQLQDQNQGFPRFKLIQQPGDPVVGQRGQNVPLLMCPSLRFASQRDEFGSTRHSVPFVYNSFHKAEAAPGQNQRTNPAQPHFKALAQQVRTFPCPSLDCSCCSGLTFSNTAPISLCVSCYCPLLAVSKTKQQVPIEGKTSSRCVLTKADALRSLG